VNGVFFFTSLFLQTVLGASPTATGCAFVPLAVLVAVVTPATPALVGRLGAARTVAGGLALVAAGLGLVATLGPGDRLRDVLPGLALIGVGSALTVPLTSSVLAAVPAARVGLAGGVLGAAREVSGLLGIAVVGAIVTAGAGTVRRRRCCPGAGGVRPWLRDRPAHRRGTRPARRGDQPTDPAGPRPAGQPADPSARSIAGHDWCSSLTQFGQSWTPPA